MALEVVQSGNNTISGRAGWGDEDGGMGGVDGVKEGLSILRGGPKEACESLSYMI